MYFLYQISMKSTFWQKIVQALLIRLHMYLNLESNIPKRDFNFNFQSKIYS